MTNRNEIQNFMHLPGNNCITTAIRNILNFYGFRYPESRVYGIAEGMGFTFRRVEGLDNPYLGGSGSGLVDSFCQNLHLACDTAEFATDEAAMDDLKAQIDNQLPCIVQVDLFYLPYFDSKTHFGGHRVIPVGYDETNVYVSDTGFLRIQACPIEKFVEARRSQSPPFSHQRRRWRIERFGERPFIDETITKSLYNVYRKFENHMHGYNLLQIFDLRDHLGDYKDKSILYQQIEKAGTGGGLGRKMYADFLDQAAQIYARSIYELSSALYEQSAALWREIALNARSGELNGTAEKLEKIYQLETRAIKVFSSFEAEDL